MEINDIRLPQFSTDHRVRCACCAFHGRHHQHHGGFRTQQTRTWAEVRNKYIALVESFNSQPAGWGARGRDITANKTPIAISNISLTQLQMPKSGENYDEWPQDQRLPKGERGRAGPN
jgi:hypothetical protein